MRSSNPAKKQRFVFVRVSEIEHARIAAEAARRGLTVADLTRSLLRVACGALPVEPDRMPAARHSERG